MDTEKKSSEGVEEKLSVIRRTCLKNFEKKLGVEIQNLSTLNVALTHSSYANEFEPRLKNNERLEFLGDAVLELASSDYLFKNFKNLSEGDLTKMRASVVCQKTLARIAKNLGVGEMILFGKSEYNSGCQCESILEDAFEAIIGAIYLECGWEVAQDFVCRQLNLEFERITDSNVSLKDYKSRLQEIIQQNPQNEITYMELSANGPDHLKTFESAVLINGKIFGQGIGHSKKKAEQFAAQEALKRLGIVY